jgi:hypothetical protein
MCFSLRHGVDRGPSQLRPGTDEASSGQGLKRPALSGPVMRGGQRATGRRKRARSMAVQARSRGGLTVGSGRRRRRRARRRRVLAGAGTSEFWQVRARRPWACVGTGDLGHVRAPAPSGMCGCGDIGLGWAAVSSARARPVLPSLLRRDGRRRPERAAARSGNGGDWEREVRYDRWGPLS